MQVAIIDKDLPLRVSHIQYSVSARVRYCSNGSEALNSWLGT